MRKLQSINMKIRQLQRDLERAEKYPNRFDPEDVYVMQEELDGLRALVLEERTILLGSHGLETDSQGRFRALVFAPRPPAPGLAGPAEGEKLEAAVSAAADAARKAGYLGPLEVDCWSWRDGSGGNHFHPLGEINARVSFGLIGRAIIEKLSESTGWLKREPARLVIGPPQLRTDSAETIELLSVAEPDRCGAWLERISPG